MTRWDSESRKRPGAVDGGRVQPADADEHGVAARRFPAYGRMDWPRNKYSCLFETKRVVPELKFFAASATWTLALCWATAWTRRIPSRSLSTGLTPGPSFQLQAFFPGRLARAQMSSRSMASTIWPIDPGRNSGRARPDR